MVMEREGERRGRGREEGGGEKREGERRGRGREEGGGEKREGERERQTQQTQQTWSHLKNLTFLILAVTIKIPRPI